MNVVLKIVPEEEKVKIDISDEVLLSLESDDFHLESFKGLKDINFYLNRQLSYEECCEFLSKLERICGLDGKVRIFTSGCNFNEMMKAIGNSKIKECCEMHIDDSKDVRKIIDSSNVISGLNFSRICCDCYFSDRYLLNFNAGEFDALCSISECKFDRKRLRKMRMTIENVWNKLIPSQSSINTFDKFSRVQLMLDFIESNNDDSYLKFFGDCSKEEAKIMFFNMLLDNYVAKVNSNVVCGRNIINNSDMVWVVTSIDGNNYGHCLIGGEKFSGLDEKGYVDGKIMLEDKHKYRDDYIREVGVYASLDCDDYNSIRRALEFKKKGINSCCSESNSLIGMPPLFPEGADKPVISYLKCDLPKKMPLLFPHGRGANKQ